MSFSNTKYVAQPPTRLPERAATFDSAGSIPASITSPKRQSHNSLSAMEHDKNELPNDLQYKLDLHRRSEHKIPEQLDSSSETEPERKSSHSLSSHGRRRKLRPSSRRAPSREDKPIVSGSKEKRLLDVFGLSVGGSSVEAERVRQTIEELQRESIKKEKANRALSRDISRLSQYNAELEEELHLQNSQIRTMQEQRMRHIETRGFMRAEDDDIVRSKIQSCMRRLQSWAEYYAIAKFSHVKEADHPLAKRVYQKTLVPDKAVEPGTFFPVYYDFVPPGIILNAELARYVTKHIFQQPFLCLGNEWVSSSDLTREPVNVSRAFDSVYQKLRLQGDVSAAHAWRSQTLRTVDPPEAELDGKSSIQLDSLRSKEDYYNRYATGFESSSAKVLFRPDDGTQRVQELLEIIRTAGKISASLWKQKIFFECWGMEKFRDIPFSAASEVMRAHSTHGLEDNDTRFNGRQIYMVVQPAIVAFGNEEGKNYHEYKVWAKAVVWVLKGHGALHEDSSRPGRC